MVVVDNSVILPLFLADEDARFSEKTLLSAAAGETLIAPSLWLNEFGNAILVCQRRKRINAKNREAAHRKAEKLPIVTEAFPAVSDLSSVHLLCEKHQLSFYDGTYLALALSKNATLATQDKQLMKAAKKEGILFE
jgi:predicted nucleic acid-binding protein